MFINKFTTFFIVLCVLFFPFRGISQSIKPPNLKKGDTIIILSPAGKVKDKTLVDAGITLANKWGLVVFLGNHLLTQNHTFAGTDTERAEDLQKALDNPSIKAIWAARGGYGTIRIIDKLDFTKFKKHPKWIIGYSDITVFHNKINQLGYQTIHGQMPLTLDLENPIQKESITTLHQALFGKKLQYKLASSKYNKTGESIGEVVGGNLSLVYSMLQSDISLNMENKILFIEDVGEPLYHIDRMIISLERAGYFKNCSGLLVGNFKLKKNEGNTFGESLEAIVLRITKDYNFPIIFDFPAGHVVDNRALILGSNINLKVTDKKTKITFK